MKSETTYQTVLGRLIALKRRQMLATVTERAYSLTFFGRLRFFS